MSAGRFDPHELDDIGLADADLAAALGAARAVESTKIEDPTPSVDFADRVMSAIADEPDPRPAAAIARAARTGRLSAVGAVLTGAWRTTFGPGFPVAARARASVVLLGAALGLMLLGGVVAAGAARLFAEPSPSTIVSPEPSISPAPTAQPESAAPTPSPTTGPTASPAPTASSEPTESAGPTGTGEPAGSAGPTGTAEPTETPEPTGTPDATEAPNPTDTPRPTDTPEPSDDSGSGSGSGSGGPGSGSGGPGPGGSG